MGMQIVTVFGGAASALLLSGSGSGLQAQQVASENPDADALATRCGKKDAASIVRGHIGIGMSEEEVTLAWGNPVSRNSKGKVQEVWKHGDDKWCSQGEKYPA
jgi:hypothetical protein